jgi:hypothetical protein
MLWIFGETIAQDGPWLLWADATFSLLRLHMPPTLWRTKNVLPGRLQRTQAGSYQDWKEASILD